MAIEGVTATDEFHIPSRTAAIANETLEVLGLDMRVTENDIQNDMRFVGAGYGIPQFWGRYLGDGSLGKDMSSAEPAFAAAHNVLILPVFFQFCSVSPTYAEGSALGQNAIQAPTDLSGEWRRLTSHEDAHERGGGPDPGEYWGLPLNDAARMRADKDFWNI